MITDPRTLASALYLAVRGADERTAKERVRRFANLLDKRGMTTLLRAVLEKLPGVTAQLDGRETVDVVSARPLQSKALATLLEAAAIDPKKSDLRMTIDPQAVGGAVVRTPNLLFDASIRGRLDRLKAESEKLRAES